MDSENPEYLPDYGMEPEGYQGLDRFRRWVKDSYTGSGMGEGCGSWESCRESLEREEAEVLLDHESGTARVMTGADPDDLEEEYGAPRYQVMGRRLQETDVEEDGWEPVRDLSGPSEGEKAVANIVAGAGVAGFGLARAGGKIVFESLSALAKALD
ncbi:MAG: hypothetical protein ABEK01_01230 [Candidatus Nanohaloarchaea archaeon]